MRTNFFVCLLVHKFDFVLFTSVSLKQPDYKSNHTKNRIMSCSPEALCWLEKCYADEEAQVKTQVKAVQSPSHAPDERHDKEEIKVEFVKHTKRFCNAPSGSKTRDLYRFTVGGGGDQKENDCWYWWRDIDGIVRILGGGGSRRPKQPTIYYFKIKGPKLSCCLDKDQSKAWEIYNQYGSNKFYLSI